MIDKPSPPPAAWDVAAPARSAKVPPEGRANFMFEHPFNLRRYELPEGILEEQVLVPMRDGIELAASVFRPAGAIKRLPVIVTATPYAKDNFEQWFYFRDAPEGNVPGGGFYLGDVTVSDHTAFEAPDPGWWVPHGYVVMLVDQPGIGRSGSNPETTPGPEARWRDVMDWIEAQPWATGKIGMSGVSALCATQWVAAKAPAPRQLKAIIPWEGVNATGPGNGYGGIPETTFPVWLEQVWLGGALNPAAAGIEGFIFDWHYDSDSITVPALVCASFSDQELHSWDTFDAFSRMRSKDKWLYGHRRQKWVAYYGDAELRLQKRFFDQFLKGEPANMVDVPRVRLEVNEDRFTYKVIQADDWPIPGTFYKSVWLDAGAGACGDQVPAAASCIITPEASGGARAVFDLRFDQAMDLVGHAALHLFVEAEGTDDVDLFVGVEKLDAAGDEVYFFSASGGNANGPVTRGWLRASCRALDEARSTDWRPVRKLGHAEPLPNGITQVHIPLMPFGTSFAAGETLRLVVQSWSGPGQWEGGELRNWDALQKGRCRIHTGPHAPSRLVLPVLPVLGPDAKYEIAAD